MKYCNKILLHTKLDMKCLNHETSEEFDKRIIEKMNRERKKYLENKNSTNVIIFKC